MSPKHFVKTLLAALVVLLSLSLASGVFAAQKVPTPTSLDGGEIVTLEQVKALVDGKKTAFFDMRSAINYGKGHIPGAKALPYREKSAKATDFDASADHVDLKQLPADKDAVIVFYSHGPTGWKSYKAAVLAVKQGYSRVKWFRNGLGSWVAAGHPIEH